MHKTTNTVKLRELLCSLLVNFIANRPTCPVKFAEELYNCAMYVLNFITHKTTSTVKLTEE